MKKLSNKEEAYMEFKRGLSSEVFSKFPLDDKVINKSLTQTILFPSSLYATGYCGLFIVFEYDSGEFVRISEKLRKEKLFESFVFDSCNVVVAKSTGVVNKFCRAEISPVPNITDTLTSLNEISFDGKSEFIVFSKKPGIFVKEDPDFSDETDLSKSIDLPGEWQDGFSNGIITNPTQRQIVYWIIVW